MQSTTPATDEEEKVDTPLRYDSELLISKKRSALFCYDSQKDEEESDLEEEESQEEETSTSN